MIGQIKETSLAKFSTRIFGWVHQDMASTLLSHHIIVVTILASVLAAFYWLVIASDRYVSEAHVIIQRTDLAQTMDFSSLLGSVGGNSHTDQLLLQDHLLSVDMLKKLDAALNLRAHYSDSQRDPLARMWYQDASMEWFHSHYLTRVSVEFDEYAGVLIVKAQGYDPKTAHAVTALLVEEGERFINEMAHSLAKDQVTFLEKQVAQIEKRTMQTRQAVLNYQNKEGLVSPQATVENIAGLVAGLEAQRTKLETERSALQAYLRHNHSSIILLNQQIAAIDKQIAQEQAKLVSLHGNTLNRSVEEFQRLEMEAEFAHEMYKTALIALETGRVEAIRTIKKVSVLQSPTQPEYPLEPRRLYNTLVFVLCTMLFAGIAHLLTAIVRDHKD